MRIHKTLVFCTALLASFSATKAWAHSLYVFAQYNGQEVSGKSYYSDMTPAAETYFEVLQQGQSTPLATGKTDLQGEFHIPVQAPSNGLLNVVVEGAEGHKSTAVAHPVAINQNDSSLLLLREDIAHLKDKIYLRDILGGLGYIVGFFGIVAWLNARKVKQSNKE
ncbi:hypothetical protein A4G18_04725 [Pasteurellaceae bacterium Pebbles2]|nr:hypothetical protein [Pasteurellaceae bacterium Pebbles2]